MNYKYNKLKGRIVEKYGTQRNFAEKAGITNVQMSKKLSGKAGLSQGDITEWASLLDISREDYASYFFS